MHCSVSPAKFFDRNQHWGSLHAAEHCTKTAKHVYSSVTGVLLTSYLLMHLGNHFSRDHSQTRGAWQTCFSFDWLLERVGGSWAKVMHTLPWILNRLGYKSLASWPLYLCRLRIWPDTAFLTLAGCTALALWVIYFTAGGDGEIFASNHHHILQNPF